MKFTNATADINGTCLQGYITADYDELVECFGDFTSEGDGYKIDVEWELTFEDGTIATIYNWKNGHNYLGETGCPVECIERWHIGGRSQRAVERVEAALFDHRNGCTTVEEKPVAMLSN
jgi:hypothetical protein